MIYTTLNRIREQSPCRSGWEKLLRNLGKTAADDEPVSFATILRSHGLEDALWCCRAEPQHASLWRHCAVDFAETARHLMTDPRSLAALDVARRHADGAASDAELAAARAAAWAAWGAAGDAAGDAARAARAPAWAAAWAAGDAAGDAARAAAWAARDAAGDAARAAAWAARGAAWAAGDAGDAAGDAARAAGGSARAAAGAHMSKLFLSRLESSGSAS